MRPQVSLSPHLENMVRKRESFVVHVISPLVLMVLYMYVTIITPDFRYSNFCTVTFFDEDVMDKHFDMCANPVTNRFMTGF